MASFACQRPDEGRDGPIPAPVRDQTEGVGAAEKTAVLAAGCFWCVEAVFAEIDGVRDVESGYAGGREETAVYELVCSGETNHAEAVRITYDPAKVTYGRLASGKAIARTLNEKAVLRSVSEFTVMGKSAPRLDGVDKVTGTAEFAGDIKRPGMLFARILRPPAHGAVLSEVDTTEAAKVDGITVVNEDGMEMRSLSDEQLEAYKGRLPTMLQNVRLLAAWGKRLSTRLREQPAAGACPFVAYAVDGQELAHLHKENVRGDP